MKRFLFFALCVIVSLLSFSQDASTHGANIFLELGGNAGTASLNYERRFSDGNEGFGGRIGVGIGAAHRHLTVNSVLTVPVGVNYLAGGGPHQLEAGAGITVGAGKFGTHTSGLYSAFFVPSLGYRYHPLQKSITLRAFLSPFIATRTTLSAGLSFGIVF